MNYQTFQLRVGLHCVIGARRMEVYQQGDVDIVPSICNFIKNETPEQEFSQEFCKFFQPVTLLKTELQHICFSVSFDKFFSVQLYQKRDSSTGVFL